MSEFKLPDIMYTDWVKKQANQGDLNVLNRLKNVSKRFMNSPDDCTEKVFLESEIYCAEKYINDFNDLQEAIMSENINSVKYEISKLYHIGFLPMIIGSKMMEMRLSGSAQFNEKLIDVISQLSGRLTSGFEWV